MKKIPFLILFILISFLMILFYIQRNETNFSIEQCENITSNRLKIVCYNLFSRNYTYCDLAQDFSNYCYDAVIPLTEINETTCLSFKEEYPKISCLVTLSIKNKNPNMCSFLNESSLSSACYARLVNYLDYFNDSSFCHSIGHESTRFLCLASKTNDMGYCYNITQEVEERTGCFGILTKNTSYCKIETTGSISKITIYSCIKNIALSLNNINICDEIQEEQGKWECKAALAEDDKICNDASDPWKDFCKLEFIKTQLTKKYLWNS
jgi:hypothetical protein